MKAKIYNKHRKGFTLIEVIVTLMIMVIVLSMSLYGINCVKRINYSITFDYYCNHVVNFINFCKNYSKANDISGYIMFERGNNKIRFFCMNGNCGRTLVKYIKLPQNIIIDSNKSKLNINRLGYMSTAGTIILKNLDNNYYSKYRKEITISVGTGYIQIKKEM